MVNGHLLDEWRIVSQRPPGAESRPSALGALAVVVPEQEAYVSNRLQVLSW